MLKQPVTIALLISEDNRDHDRNEHASYTQSEGVGWGREGESGRERESGKEIHKRRERERER